MQRTDTMPRLDIGPEERRRPFRPRRTHRFQPLKNARNRLITCRNEARQQRGKLDARARLRPAIETTTAYAEPVNQPRLAHQLEMRAAARVALAQHLYEFGDGDR